MKEGFIVGDGTYAAIPFEDKLMIIHNGQQMDVVNTEQQARVWIQQHKKMNPKPRAPRKPRATQKSQKIEKPSSGQQGSQEQKPKVTKTTSTTPKSKVPVREDSKTPAPIQDKKIPNGNPVTVKKPSTRRKKAP